jgi:hypothetical protein
MFFNNFFNMWQGTSAAEDLHEAYNSIPDDFEPSKNR